MSIRPLRHNGRSLLISHIQDHSERFSSRGRTLRTKALALCTLLIFLPNLLAQSRSISSVTGPMALYINIVEGEEALNNIHDRTAREPIVQVTDENKKPVKGAAVTFTDVAGATGAAASFGGLVTYTVVTDADGKAVGKGFRPNGITGKHQVEVAATLGMLTAAIMIHENNVAEGGALSPSHGAGGGLGTSGWFLAEFGAAATTIGTVLGVHGNGEATSSVPSSTTTSTTTTTTTTTTAVPEIDPSMAFGCLVFLAGAVAVLRGR